MEPITREEYYLAKIAGTYEGNTPEPVTIEEYYLATMAGDYSGNTPQPVTRLQYYMAKVAGVWGGSVPAGSRCVQRCAHSRYRQPRPLGKFKGESWAGIPYPIR